MAWGMHIESLLVFLGDYPVACEILGAQEQYRIETSC